MMTKISSKAASLVISLLVIMLISLLSCIYTVLTFTHTDLNLIKVNSVEFEPQDEVVTHKPDARVQSEQIPVGVSLHPILFKIRHVKFRELRAQSRAV